MASLTEENIKSLYRCENRAKRRNILAKILKYPPCDDNEDDIKTSVMLDYYLETIDFASGHGFSWQQGLGIFELMTGLLDSTLGLSLLEATEHFKTVLKTYAKTFPPQRMTSVIDFVFSFFFNYFNLYKFVFTNERDLDRRTIHMSIEAPPQDIPALGSGTEISEWECQQVLKNLEIEHNTKLMEKQLQLDGEIERLNFLIHDQLSLLDINQPISEEDLHHIVEKTVRMHIASASSTMQHMIEESQEKLMYEFKRMTMKQEQDPNKAKKASSGNVLNKKKDKQNQTGKR